MPAPRPCPFCGSWRVGVRVVEARTRDGQPQYVVECECCARGPIVAFREPFEGASERAQAEATRKWDERAVLLRAVVDVPSDGVIYFSEGGVLRVRYPDGRVM